MDLKHQVETFDIIIIGGGTAGSVLAARLSSSPAIRILVLEAGQNRNEDPVVRTPGLSRRLQGNPDYDWKFQTSPEAGLNGRVILQPRGKLWGGSSAINSHALVYPSKGYHDAWGTLIGNGNSWNWEGVKDYYRRFQNLQEPSEEVKRQLDIGYSEDIDDDDLGKKSEQMNECGREGIQASFPVTPNVLQRAWAGAIHDFGYQNQNDPRDGEVLGGSTTTSAVDSSKAERSHAGVAFLEPSENRDNLIVKSNVLVEKILFKDQEQDGKLVAMGVLYSQEGLGENVVVHARKEVILCAGTFGSPKLLELSGIGQRERLVAKGIKCVRDLPGVGENLQDHLNFGPSVEVHDSIDTLDDVARDPTIIEDAKRLYEAEHKGFLAEGSAHSFSYLPSQALSSQDEQQDLESLVGKTLQERSSTISKGLKAQYDIIQHMINDPGEATATVFMVRIQRYTPRSDFALGNYMTIIAMLSYPFSRGTSHITSADANEAPEIKFNYLQHPLDLEVFGRHVIQIGRMLKVPSLSEVLKADGNTLPRGFPRHAAKMDDVKEYLRQFAATNYHPAGTCAMMSEELGGVVDESLKVYGTTNLRVCDASVFPIVPRGNILSTVYAVAEKGADILKESLEL